MSKKLYAAVAAGTVLALGATGAQAATASGTATANIVEAITITENAGLNFGTIVPDTAAQTVAITTAGARTCSGGLVCSGSPLAGGFTATGTTGQAVSISVAATTTLNRSGGGASMGVSGLTPSVTSATLAGSPQGSATFTVGGTLAVGASQMAGVYNGTYAVNVNYN
jgi:hypothetical protein